MAWSPPRRTLELCPVPWTPHMLPPSADSALPAPQCTVAKETMSLLGNQPVWGALGPDIHPFLLTLKVNVPGDFHIWLCCYILSVRFHSDPNITITKMMLENRSSPWVRGWPRGHSTRSATRQDPAGATVLGPVGSALGPDRAASDLPSVTTQAGDVTEEAPRGVSELMPCSGDGPLRTSFSP